MTGDDGMLLAATILDRAKLADQITPEDAAAWGAQVTALAVALRRAEYRLDQIVLSAQDDAMCVPPPRAGRPSLRLVT